MTHHSHKHPVVDELHTLSEVADLAVADLATRKRRADFRDVLDTRPLELPTERTLMAPACPRTRFPESGVPTPADGPAGSV